MKHTYLRRSLISLSLLAGLVITPLCVMAQDELPPLQAFHKGSRLLDVSMGVGSSLDQDVTGSSFAIGAGYHYYMTAVASFGLDISADNLGTITPPDGSDAFDFQSVGFTSQLTFSAKRNSISPFVAVGTGPYILQTNETDDGSINMRWGFVGKAGFRIVGIRPVIGLDARYNIIILDPKRDFGFGLGETHTQYLSFRITLARIF